MLLPEIFWDGFPQWICQPMVVECIVPILQVRIYYDGEWPWRRSWVKFTNLWLPHFQCYIRHFLVLLLEGSKYHEHELHSWMSSWSSEKAFDSSGKVQHKCHTNLKLGFPQRAICLRTAQNRKLSSSIKTFFNAEFICVETVEVVELLINLRSNPCSNDMP